VGGDQSGPTRLQSEPRLRRAQGGKEPQKPFSHFPAGLLTLCSPGCGQARGRGWGGRGAHSLSGAGLHLESSNPCPEGPLPLVSKVKTMAQVHKRKQRHLAPWFQLHNLSLGSKRYSCFFIIMSLICLSKFELISLFVIKNI